MAGGTKSWRKICRTSPLLRLRGDKEGEGERKENKLGPAGTVTAEPQQSPNDSRKSLSFHVEDDDECIRHTCWKIGLWKISDPNKTYTFTPETRGWSERKKRRTMTRACNLKTTPPVSEE